MCFCKVQPSEEECSRCRIQAFYLETELNCEECMWKNNVYELINVGYNRSIGNWAMVLKDGKIERVKLERVYDINRSRD